MSNAKNFFDVSQVDPALVIIALAVSLLYSIYLSCSSSDKKEGQSSKKPAKILNFEKLEKHTDEFKHPQILTVCDGKVHVAIGYGLANVIVIEGENGCVVIDTLESEEAAEKAIKDIKQSLKTSPLKL